MGRRALGRATLARQLLLERASVPTLAALRRVVALNAQDPRPPYLALWARLEGFARDELTRLLEERAVVRAGLLRGTQHMVASDDYRWLWPLLRPVQLRVWRGAFGRYIHGIDHEELAAAAAHELRDGRILTRPQLRDRLAVRFPVSEREALGRSVQALLPVVHPPPVGTWDRRGATPFALAEHWLGRPLAASPSPDDLVLRYLAAYGPAGVKDVQAWSGLTRLREVVERLRPRLRAILAEDGTELYDLPDAPRPDPDTPAPVRLLPEFDNVLLAHADRTRVMTDGQRRQVCVGAAVAATVLVDGTVAGTWTLEERGGRVVLAVEPLRQLSAADREAVTDEAARLLGFVAPHSAHEVRL